MDLCQSQTSPDVKANKIFISRSLVLQWFPFYGWPRNSRNLLKQSKATLKQVTSCPSRFPALTQLFCFQHFEFSLAPWQLQFHLFWLADVACHSRFPALQALDFSSYWLRAIFSFKWPLWIKNNFQLSFETFQIRVCTGFFKFSLWLVLKTRTTPSTNLMQNKH